MSQLSPHMCLMKSSFELMQMLMIAPHRVRICKGGFTLLELLVVLVIVALGASLATLSLPQPTRSSLDRDAAQMAALMDAARSYAAAVQSPVRVEPALNGYRFVGIQHGNWKELSGDLKPRTFSTDAVSNSLPVRGALLGPEPVGEPLTVTIAAGAEVRVIASDGASEFIVSSGQ
jgi:general secretion pathway protein H